MVSTALTLSAIQIAGVTDLTGFSNADKHIGAFLAKTVEADPENTENVRSLASLLSKYRRQVEGMTCEEFFLEVKALAHESKITPEQRERAKRTIIVASGVHPKFGPRVALSFPYNEGFVYLVKQYGGRAFKDAEGWKWFLTAGQAKTALPALQERGAIVVGKVEDVIAEVAEVEQPVPQIQEGLTATLEGDTIRLAFPYDKEMVAVVKSLPIRKYDAVTKTWTIPALELGTVIQAFEESGLNTSPLQLLISQVPMLAQPEPLEPTVQFKDEVLAQARDYQKEGIAFISQPLVNVRKKMVGGSSVRGFILGDDMGLGKTIEAMIAADAIATSGDTILVVCPASVKIQWQREIHKFLGKDQDTFIVDGKGVEKHRWVIVNYDILAKHYVALSEMGFAILILDEAHYIKNRESNRSKLIIGGLYGKKKKQKDVTVSLPQEPTENDPRTKARKKVKGLAHMATKRVYCLTGTLLSNKLRDAFNPLRAVGHPLGKNFKWFGDRYCDPVVQYAVDKYGKPTGRTFGTSYDGRSNVEELRRKIDPIFIQRKKEDKLPELPPKQRSWLAVEVDTKLYGQVMDEYKMRRAAGELQTAQHHLALLTQARNCTSVAKVPATIELVEDALEQGVKCAVFTVYSKSLDLLAEHFGDRAVVIEGDVPSKKRQERIDAFQDPNGKPQVFLANLKAGGIGINLTAATQVFFVDLDWTPANHLQGEDRACRMGQTKSVNVKYILAANTMDEDIAALLEEKFDMVQTFEELEKVSLFADLVERLLKGPQNEGLKALVFGDRSSRH